MKKLLVIAAALLALVSCTEKKVEKEEIFKSVSSLVKTNSCA